ncbi:putative toxin-antitoxin system toxin component, PIN family [Rhodanobacter sp. C06]|uniref:putative toxin-antitoxin system toxin component, PIN family n=1 Tax=Rhodanobacter sp. C06 TaxID=1945854 RepID=UPI0009866347|nr:putative toxin-antitoxin system toxin component, PIN family [Rhodanobacter sp. C06]OOG50345.1 putative toxin-antitoxin system toxin component, PIN family [Rhodanobacter sp. C06]
MATLPRLVLDTNVCLDLFVFGDASCATLREVLRAGAVQAMTDAACRDEWLRVLGYPQLALDAARRAAAVAAFDESVCLLPTAERLVVPAMPKLPRCADPDDQRFLELAQASGAQWLLSRDRELLKLTRRTRREHGFDILAPQGWAQVYSVAGNSSLKPV